MSWWNPPTSGTVTVGDNTNPYWNYPPPSASVQPLLDALTRLVEVQTQLAEAMAKWFEVMTPPSIPESSTIRDEDEARMERERIEDAELGHLADVLRLDAD